VSERIRPGGYDVKLPFVLRDGSMDDWYVLQDHRWQYVSDACVEGDAEEWRQIATALIEGTSISFKRCAAVRKDEEWSQIVYEFYSPRNSQGKSARLVGRDQHIALAQQILALLDPFKAPLT